MLFFFPCSTCQGFPTRHALCLSRGSNITTCLILFFSYLGVFLDGYQSPDRQPDRLLVVDVHELGLPPGRLPSALDATDLWNSDENKNRLCSNDDARVDEDGLPKILLWRPALTVTNIVSRRTATRTHLRSMTCRLRQRMKKNKMKIIMKIKFEVWGLWWEAVSILEHLSLFLFFMGSPSLLCFPVGCKWCPFVPEAPPPKISSDPPGFLFFCANLPRSPAAINSIIPDKFRSYSQISYKKRKETPAIQSRKLALFRLLSLSLPPPPERQGESDGEINQKWKGDNRSTKCRKYITTTKKDSLALGGGGICQLILVGFNSDFAWTWKQ